MGSSQGRPAHREPRHADGEAPPSPEALGEHAIKISHLENVWSYYLFMIPMEESRAPGRFTWNKGLACSLVLAALLLQSVLLYAIFEKIVNGDVAWRDSIVARGSSWSPFAAASTCSSGGSLCTLSNGTFSCAPPSVQLTDRWEELDLNGDGIWTRVEAEEARDALRCKYAVDPLEVFDVFAKLLRQREEHIWLHPGLREGREIRRAYFTYAAGDLIMCGYRNQDMCANLLMNGAFDAPLKYGTAPRVGKTIESALAYCYKLLEPGGTCERMLPSTYSVWRKSSERQCRGAKYAPSVYTHPTTGVVKSMLVVDYAARRDYSRVDTSMLFFVYKAIIIGMFLLAMYAEFKDVAVHVAWAARFPSADEFPGEAVKLEQSADGGDQVACRIQGASRAHRVQMAALTALRTALLVVLTVVGVTFLQQDTDWINLLLNGVAMVFVAEIASHLYSQVVSSGLRERCEAAEPMEVALRPPLAACPGAGDLLGFCALAAFVALLMGLHYVAVGRPLSQALACACVSEGPHCREAQHFSPAFWEGYWDRDVPAVFAEVEALRAAGAASG
eukprot:CAMPEP_0171186074 /NCGR_PEP_ID=MMETSP0790-20130122/16624_1 /TAXON_ID=2925 /ORGANISM="Alexandrium catenella, Strain OF101" /LENGTH=559 /DNA_ID=CAMNT_0011651105 /DNA_START=94 /DNA_END=1769 /DNA_ORIENTATION=+